jgi:hypothetical protein
MHQLQCGAHGVRKDKRPTVLNKLRKYIFKTPDDQFLSGKTESLPTVCDRRRRDIDAGKLSETCFFYFIQVKSAIATDIKDRIIPLNKSFQLIDEDRDSILFLNILIKTMDCAGFLLYPMILLGKPERGNGM